MARLLAVEQLVITETAHSVLAVVEPPILVGKLWFLLSTSALLSSRRNFLRNIPVEHKFIKKNPSLNFLKIKRALD